MMRHKHWPIEKERRRSRDENEHALSFKTGLRQKFILTISALIGFFSLAFFVFYFYSTKIILTEFYQNQCLEKSKRLATAVAYAAPQLAPTTLAPMLNSMLPAENLLYVSILNTQGEVVDAKAIPDITLPRALTYPELVEHLGVAQTLVLPEGGQMEDLVTPIVIPSLNPGEDPQTIGFIRIGIQSMGQSKFLLYRSIWLVFGIGVFIMFGILAALYLYRIIISPIQQLARAMKVVAESDIEFDDDGLPAGRRFRRGSDLNLHIYTNDEIEQLADEFTIMVKKLETSYNQLEEMVKVKASIAKEKSRLVEEMGKLNKQHEEVIKERTREIVEKNLRLYEISEELQFQKEELIGANEDLEKISRMKSEFLASMSHELRTPLNAIIGFAEVLKDKMFGDINDRQEKYLANILNSGKHLLNLINNILDIAKVEAGKMSLTISPYAVNKVIDEVQNIIRTLAYKKNIQLKLALCQDLIVEGDAARFKQILYNLLSNAIKFTEEKGDVQIITQEVGEGVHFDGGAGSKPFTTEQASFLLVVKDSGIGIKPDDQDRIFNEFEQLDQTSARQYEGTGLGLPLTRQLVYLHGGHIWLESHYGEGTSVHVVLPIKTRAVSLDENEETP